MALQQMTNSTKWKRSFFRGECDNKVNNVWRGEQRTEQESITVRGTDRQGEVTDNVVTDGPLSNWNIYIKA